MPTMGRLTQLNCALEPMGFVLLLVAYLIPIWAFTYLPTQDGPSHLNNAQILKDYAHWDECNSIFEIRAEPLPNLTSHMLLAALLYVASPLVAEKLLVSLYVVGFAAAFRYFLQPFGPRRVALSWSALLLVYTRCFWMGFYNYCLGLALFWLLLGYLLRRRNELGWRVIAILSLLFLATYFTHLSIFLLSLLGAACIALAAAPRRLLSLSAVVAAALPASGLTAYYFGSTGFVHAPSAMQIVEQPLARLSGETTRTTFATDLFGIDGELFAHHVGDEVPGTLILVGFLLLQFLFCAVERQPSVEPTGTNATGRLFPILFAVLIAAMYFLLPDDLGAHGGFIKARTAPLFFLFLLPTLRESSHAEVRWFFRALTLLLAVLNLMLVAATIAAGNRVLEEYNAGIAAVGTGKRIFVMQTDPRAAPLVNPLLHAADYYCVGTRNVNMDNYEAATLHFPVKYRAGIERGRNFFSTYHHRDLVDVILCWQTRAVGPPRGAENWRAIFGNQSLHIYVRP